MEGVDLISNLPNPLLVDIVSRLSDTEGVRTSVLSQRWKTLWKNSSHLNFDQRIMLKFLVEIYLQEKDSSMRLSIAKRCKAALREEEIVDVIAKATMLINSVIDGHLGPLKSCKIRHFFESCVSGHAKGWMRRLIKKGVREISMEQESDYVVQQTDNSYSVQQSNIHISCMLYLPFKVFSGFEVLKLKNYYVKTLPSRNPQQVLKTLMLNDVSLPKICFQEILSYCSALENLTLEECHIIREIKIESPNLKFFKICNTFLSEISVCAINLEVIEIDTIYCNADKLVLQTPKLQVLRSYFDLKRGVSLYSPFWDKLLTTKEIIEVCSGRLSPQGSRIGGIFGNLVTLSINLDLENIINAIVLSLVLKSCHVLENLEINNQVDDGRVYDQNEDYFLLFPKHIFWQRELSKYTFLNLRTLSIRGFMGKYFEVELLKHIITIVKNMERITIWFVDGSKWEEATAMLCLLSFPKASAKLSITFKPGT